MRGQRLGSGIAAVFGLVYVVVNTAAMPTALALALRVLGSAAFVAVMVHVGRRPAPADAVPTDAGGLGPAYWLVVVIEVVALVAGVRVLAGPLDVPNAGVAWVSVVVGLHFFALAVVFREPFFHALGAAIAICGGVGLGLVAAGTTEAIVDGVSGVLPGGLLLATGWWGIRRAPGHAPPQVLRG